MVIIQDTREQKPLEFDHDYVEFISKEKLSIGDYGCRYKCGTVAPVFFERKSISDLFDTRS